MSTTSKDTDEWEGDDTPHVCAARTESASGPATVVNATEFATRLRARERLLGYWSVMDCPIATEWIAHIGWDYIGLDLQHGIIDYSGMVTNLLAIDSAAGPVGLVRVEANNATAIGRALDAGAAGVIVPSVSTAAEAAQAVAAAKYPPQGIRSNLALRGQLRIGPLPAAADRDTVVLAMIEDVLGLANVEEIAAVPGLDGIYVGPSDLRISLGGKHSQDPSVDEKFERALLRIQKAAASARIAAGMHTHDGASAARRLSQGYTFASVASDLVHLKLASAAHLKAAQDGSRAITKVDAVNRDSTEPPGR
jgi:4-hydroxy-2-oxoheptanedioate aldolase